MARKQHRVAFTSLESYQTIMTTGLLARQKMEVYQAVAELGPITGSELDAALKRDDEMDPPYSRRLSELERLGVVQRAGTRTCAATGNVATQWVITDRLPEKPKSEHVARPDAETIRYVVEWCGRHASTLPPEFDALLTWLRDGAKCPKGH